jgi:hypothetical protein
MALAIVKKEALYFILLLPSPTIPEDDLAKSWKMTYWGLANSSLRQAGIGQVIFRDLLVGKSFC